MRRIPLLLRTCTMGILLGALPAVAHAQSTDGTAKPATGTMKDSAAMTHDGSMGKNGMAKDGMSHAAMAKDSMHGEGATMGKNAQKTKKAGKMKSTGVGSGKGAMAEPARTSQP